MGQIAVLVVLIGVVSLGSQLAINTIRGRVDRRNRRRDRAHDAAIDLRDGRDASAVRSASGRIHPFIHLDLTDAAGEAHPAPRPGSTET